MKYLFLFITALFILQGCSDEGTSTAKKECRSDSECKEWQVCNDSSKCELKEGMCEKDVDCTDEIKVKCSFEHTCVEPVEVEGCTAEGNECVNNTNGKTVCIDDKCAEPVEVEDCTEEGNECANNTNGKTVCGSDKKCQLPPNVENCTEEGNECANNTNGKTVCVDDKCAEPVEVENCTAEGNECANNTNGKTVCVDDKCAEPVEVKDCTEDGNECANNTNGATECKDNKCLVPGCEASEEICDGIDNDCDGSTDEDLTAPKADKQFGVCENSLKVCDGVNGWVEPDYSQIANYEETETSCDEIDNDCDNAVDEGCGGCTDGAKKDCGVDVGSCEKGQQTCENGVWGDCIGGVTPTEEVCDGKDNDCNGDIDDNLVAPNAENQDGVCANSKKVCALDTEDNTVKWLEPDYTQIANYEETETLCDGLDNDCNGETDEGLTTIYYRDEDGDTFGKPSDSVEACSAPDGYVERGSDCKDDDADINPGAVELCDGIDNNCDGHADEGFVNTDGDALPDCMDTDDDDDGDPDTTDCAPLDATINHSAAEACDTVDNNCDGSVDEGCPCVAGETQECGSSNVGECKKGTQTCDNTGTWGDCVGVVESVDEICDGKDNNCDGSIDENFTDTDNDKQADCIDPDDDNDGISDLNDNCQFTPNADQINSDDDAEGDACDSDDDNDGDPDNTDCAPLDASINHSAAEACDTVDNNCDGTTDEYCNCVDGNTQECGTDAGECVKGTQTCENGAWGECVGEVKPSPEVCDGKDNDCDGKTDTDDNTLEVAPLADNQNGICNGSKKVCAGPNGWVDPVYSDLPDYEADDTSCNGIDNNCSGENDEGYVVTDTSCGVGECLASGNLECQDGEEVDTCIAGEPSDEVCDGKDNNCDGDVDDNGLLDIAPDADMQDGVCAGSKKVCNGADGWGEPDYTLIDAYESEEVTCDDLDNDCDASTDENPIELCTSSSIDNPTIKACIKDINTQQSSCKQVLAHVSYLALGYQHSCAFNSDRLANGEAYCWGDNERGELGNANNTNYYTPRKVDSSLEADLVMESDSSVLSNCSLMADGSIKCWGSNVFGQLGSGDNDDSNIPVAVQVSSGFGTDDLSDIINISVGTGHVCSVYDDGDDNFVYCWGHNDKGQLGDNSTNNRNYAVKVRTKNPNGYGNTDLVDVEKVVAGFAHSCALMENNKVYCWGDNSKGQLGDDSNEDYSELAIEVPNLDNVVDIVAGANFTCVNYINDAGTAFDIKCWGDNSDKQIKDSLLATYDEPVSLGMSNVDDFVANGADICYLLDTDVIQCHGDNSKNQLGASSPNVLSGTKGYNIVSGDLGVKHICVIVNGDSNHNYRAVMCRGLNDEGQDGVGYLSSNPDYLKDFHFVLAGQQPENN